MVNIKKLETIQIESNSKEEVEEVINNYLKLGYKQDDEIYISCDKNDKYKYFTYVTKNEF